MNLDNLLVLNIFNAGISLIMGLYMFFLRSTSYKQGTGYWAVGSLVVGFGLIIKSVSSYESFLYLAAAPISITLGLYLYLAGIWKFKGKKIKNWLIFGIPGLDFIQSVIFIGFYHSHKLQIGIHIFFLIIYCLLAFFEMIESNPTQKKMKNIFRLNAFLFSVFMILLLLNAYFLILDVKFHPFALSTASIIINIVSGFIMIALTFGFLSAVNFRLTFELEDQLNAKTKFMSIIAHDLKSPVGNIMNFMDLLQNEKDLSETDRKRYLRILNNLSQSTFHLLQNLLEWTTKSKYLGKDNLRKIDLNNIVSENIEYFESSMALKSINLKVNAGGKTFISGNTDMLKTILRNLVSNAVKFTPKGGIITISTEKIRDSIRLSVTDSGIGIKSDIINSLFKFETSKSTKGTEGESGSGIGLVLCKELVNSNGGVMHIESREGEGTRVMVDFPSAK